MSHVTGLVLIWSLSEGDRYDANGEHYHKYPDGEEPPIAALSAFLRERGYEEDITDQSDAAFGAKHPQFCLYTAGHNYFPEDDFAALFLAQDWNYPQNTLLIMQPEHGETRVFRPVGEGKRGD